MFSVRDINLPLWTLCPGLLCTFVFVYTVYKRISFALLGYPSSNTLPLLGDLPEVAKEGLREHQLSQLRKYGKVFGNFTGNRSTLVVADASMIRQIFIKDLSGFPNRKTFVPVSKNMAPNVAQLGGAHWKNLRTTFLPMFSVSKVKTMEPLIHKSLETFVECVEDRLQMTDTVDLQELLAALTMDVVCSQILGIDASSQHSRNGSFLKYTKRMLKSLGGFTIFLLVLFPDFTSLLRRCGVSFYDNESVDSLTTAILEVLDTRRKQKGAEHRDALQLMLNSQMRQGGLGSIKKQGACSKRMTEDEIVSNILGFIVAGYDTTSSAMTLAAYCLATHCDVQDRLFDEIKTEVGSKRPTFESINRMQYLDMVVSETLRLYPPSPTINRQANHAVNVCGYEIPSGLVVTVPVYGLHRIEEYWLEPEKFDPERFSPENKMKINPYTYMPFGMGPKSCIASKLALMDIKIMTVTLLQHFRIFPSTTTRVPPKFSPSVITHPMNGMQLKMERR